MGKMRNAHKIAVGISKRKRLVWVPRHRWEGNIKMNFKETI
jgi:hypothetical protein